MKKTTIEYRNGVLINGTFVPLTEEQVSALAALLGKGTESKPVKETETETAPVKPEKKVNEGFILKAVDYSIRLQNAEGTGAPVPIVRDMLKNRIRKELPEGYSIRWNKNSLLWDVVAPKDGKVTKKMVTDAVKAAKTGAFTDEEKAAVKAVWESRR